MSEERGRPDADAATKCCPDCAETILAAARVCRFCGYRFAVVSPEPATVDQETKGRGIGAVFLYAVIGGLIAMGLAKGMTALGGTPLPIDLGIIFWLVFAVALYLLWPRREI
jgi:hypothetical protein